MVLEHAKFVVKAALYHYYDIAKLLRRPYAFIHILAHPRSGSSLLVHLLASHPNICGFGETKLQYTSERDLEKLPNKVLSTLRRFPRLGNEKYILDKLVHDYLLSIKNASILTNENCRVIFLIREPHATINSIIKALDYDLDKAIDSYLQRLNSLKKYADVISKRKNAVFIRYNELLYNTEDVFNLLEQFLGLRVPMSQEYEILRTTGNFGYGDFSENIFSGYIKRGGGGARTQLKKDKIDDEVYIAYEQCCVKLRKVCMNINSASSDSKGIIVLKDNKSSINYYN